MNLRHFYLFFALSLAGFLFYNSSGGPAAVQGQDRTGSPLSSANCQSCHSSGAFSPTITVEMLDEGTPVTDYEGGKTYILSVTIEPTTGDPARFGFQAVALTGADDVQAGSFGTPPNNIQVTNLNGRQYPEHSTPNTSNTMEIEWTAPAAGTGDVRVYAAGIAANNANGSGGDGGVRLIDPLVLTELVSSDNEVLAGNASLELLRNPVREYLPVRLSTTQAGDYQLRLLDLNGRTHLQRTLQLAAGQQTLQLDTDQLTGGVYLLSLSDGRRVITRKVVRQ